MELEEIMPMMNEKTIIYSASRQKTLKFGDVVYTKDFEAKDWVIR